MTEQELLEYEQDKRIRRALKKVSMILQDTNRLIRHLPKKNYSVGESNAIMSVYNECKKMTNDKMTKHIHKLTDTDMPKYGNCYWCGQPNYKEGMCHTQTCDMYR